jgi:hypothetical protein
VSPLVDLVLTLIELHTPNGHPVEINAREISSLRQPLDVSGHWTKGTGCILVMTNGKFNAVHEDCDQVRKKLDEAK